MKISAILFFAFQSALCMGQDLSSRSNEIPLDFRKLAEIQNGSVPKITWLNPKNEISFLPAGPFNVKLEIASRHPLKSVFLFIREKATRNLKGTFSLPVTGTKTTVEIEKTITLVDGIIELEILAQNETGFKAISKKEIQVRKPLP
jgi:hypothetical protein